MQYWHWKLRAVRCSQSNDLYRVSEWREIKSLKFTIHKNKISLSATNNDSLWPNKRFIGLWCQCSLAVLLNQRMHRATLNSFSFLLTVLSPDCVHKPHTWHFINVGGAVLDVVVNQQKKKKKTKKKKKRRIHRQIYTDEQSEQKKREYKSHSYLFSFSYKSYFFDKIVSSFTSRNRRIFICISCQWKKNNCEIFTLNFCHSVFQSIAYVHQVWIIYFFFNVKNCCSARRMRMKKSTS